MLNRPFSLFPLSSQSAAGSCHRSPSRLPPRNGPRGDGDSGGLQPHVAQPPCPADAKHVLSPETLSVTRRRMESRRRDMELLSNSMAAYAHIRANPESFGLYFVLGVCFGLVLTLCLLVLRISCRPVTRPPPCPRDLSEDEEEEDDEEDEEEDTVDHAASESLLPMTEIPLESHGPGDGALAINVFASAEELERAQRLEERERIIREIWRNGQPDILGTGTGTLGRVHYY
ncbi:protein eva-1 homolog B isoform X1 [Grus americana]|uniref:protein eva-1 homolog B isoform X1 n=1 Tax=Grus americana TaxID=9117 RepID=UPI002407E4E9|nr:protein eva-1 homolog B isoform X1 [Grus americana]